MPRKPTSSAARARRRGVSSLRLALRPDRGLRRVDVRRRPPLRRRRRGRGGRLPRGGIRGRRPVRARTCLADRRRPPRPRDSHGRPRVPRRASLRGDVRGVSGRDVRRGVWRGRPPGGMRRDRAAHAVQRLHRARRALRGVCSRQYSPRRPATLRLHPPCRDDYVCARGPGPRHLHPALLPVPDARRQQFTATGSYDDATTKDLTTTVTWASGTTASHDLRGGSRTRLPSPQARPVISAALGPSAAARRSR